MPRDKVTIICPECETSARVPVSEAPQKMKRHNENLHDGREVVESPSLIERMKEQAEKVLGGDDG